MFDPQRVIYCPNSRSRTKISEHRYEIIKNFILNTLRSEKEISFGDLLTRAEDQQAKLLGSVTAWYVLKIKQDLEARKIIKVKRFTESRVQIIRINKSGGSRNI